MEAEEASLRGDDTADIVVREKLRLVRGTHEETTFVQDTRARGVFIDLLANVLVETVQENVAKLVATYDRLVIDVCDTGDEARLRVVGKDEQLARGDGAVDAVECRFLHVANNDSCSHNIDRRYSGRETLPPLVSIADHIGCSGLGETHAVFAFTQQCLFTHLVQTQRLANTSQHRALEGSEAKWDLVRFRLSCLATTHDGLPKGRTHLVHELKYTPLLLQGVHAQPALFARFGDQGSIDTGSDDEERLPTTSLKVADCQRERSLVLVQLDRLQRLVLPYQLLPI